MMTEGITASDQRAHEQHEAKIQALLAARDYTGAAALEGQRAAAKTENETEGAASEQRAQEQHAAKIQALLAARDYKGAAALEGQRAAAKTENKTEGAASEQRAQEQHEEKIQALLAARDYAGAAALQKECQAQRLAEHNANLDNLIAKKDYAGAAALEASWAERSLRSSTTAARARGNTTASLAQAKQRSNVISNPRNRIVDATVRLGSLYNMEVAVPQSVTLEKVRVLSIGKRCSVPAAKGKGKGGGKDKGKSKGRGKGKGGKDGGWQDCQVVYLGQDGYTICTMALGDDVSRIPNASRGSLADARGLKPRMGQVGVLQWDAGTNLALRLEDHDTESPRIFPYITDAISDDFATKAHMQGAAVGTFIALVLRAQAVEERVSDYTGDSYLVVHGIDMDGSMVGPLRLFRFDSDDMDFGRVYIVRGLKVVVDTQWSYEQHQYVPRVDGTKNVECSYRTALEDVSDVDAIMQYFP